MKERIHTDRHYKLYEDMPWHALASMPSRLIGWVWTLSFFTLAGNAQPRITTAVEDSLLHRDFRFVETINPWLTSHNGAMLTLFQADNISEAQLSATREYGGLTDFSGSNDVVRAHAAVASYYRISPRTVVSGSMDYDNFTGKGMGGSAFIVTDRKPFDIVEDSLTNVGKKHLDTYHLTGGVGIELFHGVSVGARLDYTAANYAKYKDLRHKNKLMDMTLTIGAMSPLGSHLTIGANYYYRRSTESVTFSTYGRDDKVYKSLINYGPFIGKVEQFEGNGFTEKSREMPMVDDYNGASVQIGLAIGRLSIANEFTAAHRTGYYGRKSPYTITFSNHSSNVYEDNVSLVLRHGVILHHLAMQLSAENLVNYFATYREKSNDNGAYYYEYYDDVKSANKLWVDGKVTYTLHLGVRDELPTWMLKTHYRWMHRKQTAYAYPYYRRQRLNNHEMGLSATHHLKLRHGVLALTAEGAFLQGNGSPFEDFTFVEPSDKQAPPPTMDAWLYREHQWLTSAQYIWGGNVRYTFVMPHLGMATYCEINFHHRKANEVNAFSAGCDHTTFGATIGCRF